MRFLDAEFVQGFIRMANDGREQGWLREKRRKPFLYRKAEEVESVKENFEAKSGSQSVLAFRIWQENIFCNRKRQVFPQCYH